MTDKDELIEAVSDHFAANTALFQILVRALEDSGALEKGIIPEHLQDYIEIARKGGRASPTMIALIEDARKSLLH